MNTELIQQQQQKAIDDALAHFKVRCKDIENEAKAKVGDSQDQNLLKEVLTLEKGELDRALIELITALNQCKQTYFQHREGEIRGEEIQNLNNLEQQLLNS